MLTNEVYSPGRASEEIGLFATVSLGKSSDELCVPLLNISNLLTIYPLDIPKTGIVDICSSASV